MTAVRRYRIAELGSKLPDDWPTAYVDSDDYDALSVQLQLARQVAEDYRKALARISDNESGVWGQWARQALDDHRDWRPGK